MKNLILDLSGNGGGYLTAAVGIAGELIDEAKLVVYTEGKKNPRFDYLSMGEGRFRKGNLVVIVDETSASASKKRKSQTTRSISFSRTYGKKLKIYGRPSGIGSLRSGQTLNQRLQSFGPRSKKKS